MSCKDILVKLAVERKVIQNGNYTLKSGRVSDYFINFGNFNRGSDLDTLGMVYAQKIYSIFENDIDLIFGPAYKGIPLALLAANKYSNTGNPIVEFAFDRKEAKMHGEGGNYIGGSLRNKKVVIVDDVLTSGTTLTGIVKNLQDNQVNIRGIVVGIDREESGLKEIQGIPIYPIATKRDLPNFK